jgi:hypothetical protein
MSNETLEVVFDHLSALRRRDIDAVAALLDPAVVHHGYSEELVCNGREAVLHNVSNGMRRKHLGIEHLELVDAGDRVIVGLAGPNFAGRPGVGDQQQVFIVFTVRDGKIIRMDDYLTRGEALGAAGIAEADWA